MLWGETRRNASNFAEASGKYGLKTVQRVEAPGEEEEVLQNRGSRKQ